jgi:hypothetical protein
MSFRLNLLGPRSTLAISPPLSGPCKRGTSSIDQKPSLPISVRAVVRLRRLGAGVPLLVLLALIRGMGYS